MGISWNQKRRRGRRKRPKSVEGGTCSQGFMRVRHRVTRLRRVPPLGADFILNQRCGGFLRRFFPFEWVSFLRPHIGCYVGSIMEAVSPQHMHLLIGGGTFVSSYIIVGWPRRWASRFVRFDSTNSSANQARRGFL